MSAQKELKFFTRDDWASHVDWYAAQFPKSTVRGEASPGYAMYPFLPSVAERAYELVPNAKLIYVVRDPIERAIANYVEFRALGFESRPIARALADVEDPRNPHICASRYGLQLERFLRLFGREQILILDRDELLHRRGATLQSTFRFLGVEECFESAGFNQMHNVGTDKVRYGQIGRFMVQHHVLIKHQGPFRHKPLIWPLRKALARKIDTTLPTGVSDSLVEYLRSDVQRFLRISGREFPGWRIY